MDNNLLAETFFNTYENFRLILAQGKITLSEFRQKFEDERRCPEQAELAPVLLSFQKIALALAEFFEVLNKGLNNENWLAIVQPILMKKQEAEEFPKEEDLLAFYLTMDSIDYNLSKHNVPTSYLWKQVNGLAMEYGYKPSSTLAWPTLIDKLSSIRVELTLYEFEDEWHLFTEERVKAIREEGIKKEYIQGLHYMSARAAFLATATEEELWQSETIWWCNLVDSTPKDRKSYYKLSLLLENTPDQKHPEVSKRLQELAEIHGLKEFTNGLQAWGDKASA